jgi:hypothetical protein
LDLSVSWDPKDRSGEPLTRPGKHTKSIKKLLKMAIEIVKCPIKNDDVP